MATRDYPENLPLSTCTGELSEDGKKFTLRQGSDLILEESSFEMLGNSNNYLETAWSELSPTEDPQDWKILGLLQVVRQGIRENFAGMRDLEIPENPTKEEVQVWLNETRVLDKRHHGAYTIPSWEDVFQSSTT